MADHDDPRPTEAGSADDGDQGRSVERDDEVGTDGPGRSSTRRRFLQGAGLGAAALVGGGLSSRIAASGSASTTGSASAYWCDTPGAAGAGATVPGPRIYDAAAPGGTPTAWLGGSPTAAASAAYGHGHQPPLSMGATALDPVTLPPTRGRGPREHTIDVVATTRAIAEGIEVEQWTYGGRSPGPVLRAIEGQRLRLTVRNRTDHDHNLHLHGRHSPLMDGWEPIPPGESFTYEVEAGPAGVHPYHCHTTPLAQHVSRGLYGTFIVDPVEPREPAHEVVLLLSGWDLDGDGRNEVYTYNGVAGFFTRNPIRVPVGELVRVYVLNMVEYDPVASFHLHAQTFDVYRTGTSPLPGEHTDTVTLTQGERAIVEFRLPERGRYMFHPHQHHMAEAGAMGWFAAV